MRAGSSSVKAMSTEYLFFLGSLILVVTFQQTKQTNTHTLLIILLSIVDILVVAERIVGLLILNGRTAPMQEGLDTCSS